MMTALVRRLSRGAALAALGALALTLGPGGLAAQKKPVTPEEAAKAMKSLQEQVDVARRERLALEAKLDKELAGDMASRAQGLAMSGEVGALMRLEAMIDSAQARLLVQRDRIRILRDEAQGTDRATLVVLVRADTFPVGDAAVALLIDGAVMKSQRYNADQARALAAGAADELYRGDIMMADHKLLLQISGKVLNVDQSTAVAAAPRKVTYVEFTLKGGKLTSATWTN